jgi:phosphoribosylaminoimidazole-succinocarboxamide synthase
MLVELPEPLATRFLAASPDRQAAAIRAMESELGQLSKKQLAEEFCRLSDRMSESWKAAGFTDADIEAEFGVPLH